MDRFGSVSQASDRRRDAKVLAFAAGAGIVVLLCWVVGDRVGLWGDFGGVALGVAPFLTGTVAGILLDRPTETTLLYGVLSGVLLLGAGLGLTLAAAMVVAPGGTSGHDFDILGPAGYVIFYGFLGLLAIPYFAVFGAVGSLVGHRLD